MEKSDLGELFDLGIVCMQQMRWQQAISVFELCLRRDSQSAPAWANLAIAYYRIGRLTEAEQRAQRAIELGPRDLGSWIAYGEISRVTGRLNDAVRAARRATQLAPKDHFGFAHLAQAYQALGDHERALRAARRAMKLFRGWDPLLHVIAGDCLTSIGKLDAALKEFEAVIAGGGKPHPVIIGEQPVVAAWKGKAYVHLLKGVVRRNRDQFRLAAQAFETVLQHDPRDAKSLGGFGYSCRNIGRFQNSLDAIDKAIEIAGEDDFLKLQRGLTLQELGRCSEALDELEAVIRSETAQSEWRSEATAYRTVVLLALQRFEDGLLACDEAIAGGVDNAITRNSRACALIMLDRPEEAKVDLERARQHSPDDPVVKGNVGNLLRVEGRHEEADALLDEALSADPNNPHLWVSKFLSLRDQERWDDIRSLQARADAELSGSPERLQTVRRMVNEASLENSLSLAAARIQELEEAVQELELGQPKAPVAFYRQRLDQFEKLLSRDDTNEEQVKQFLKLPTSRFLFGLGTIRTYTEHELGAEFRADFVLEFPSCRYVMVEIEPPRSRLWTGRGRSAALSHACQQVEDWQDWVEDNISYAQRKLQGCKAPEGLVVIGRSASLSDDDRRRLERSNVNTRGRLTIKTYDDLITEARAVIDNLSTVETVE